MMKRIFVCLTVLCCTMAAGAQQVVIDTKTAAQMAKNTAEAYVQEHAHKLQNDTIKKRTINMLTSILTRNTMQTLDMNQRRSNSGFGRESALYGQLVREANRFIVYAAEFAKVAVMHPRNSAFCHQAVVSMAMQAKSVVKEAVVIGMNSRVPNPFKVDYNRWYNGTDTVSAYKDDADLTDKDKELVKQTNLLLPDERIRIVNRAIYRLQEFNMTLRATTYKIKYHEGPKQFLRQMFRQDYNLMLANQYAFDQVKRDLDRLGRLW